MELLDSFLIVFCMSIRIYIFFIYKRRYLVASSLSNIRMCFLKFSRFICSDNLQYSYRSLFPILRNIIDMWKFMWISSFHMTAFYS